MMHYQEKLMLSYIEDVKRIQIDSYLRDGENAFKYLKKIQKRVDDSVTRILPYLKDSTIDKEAYIQILNDRRQINEKLRECILQKDEVQLHQELEENRLKLVKDFSSLSEWTYSASYDVKFDIKYRENDLLDDQLNELESRQEGAAELEEILRPYYEQIKGYEDRLAKWKSLPKMKRMFTQA